MPWPRDREVFTPDRCEHGRLRRTSASLLEASVRSTQKIFERNRGNGPITLCLSDGVDSQCLLQSFVQAKVPCRAVSVRFEQGLNEFDLRHVGPMCRKWGVSHTFVDLDIIKFFSEGKSLDYAAEMECSSPQLAVHFWLMDQLDGVPVWSWNPPWIDVSKERLEERCWLPNRKYWGYVRYGQKRQRPLVPFFFIHSPRQTAAALATPTAQALLRRAGSAATQDQMNYTHKVQIYREGGFQVVPQKSKCTGFERVKTAMMWRLNTEVPVFDVIYRYPWERIFFDNRPCHGIFPGLGGFCLSADESPMEAADSV